MSDINALKNYFLNPFDIFWKKKSGKKVLLSKTGELASLVFEKLDGKKMDLVFEDLKDPDWINQALEFVEKLENLEGHILHREKNKAKTRNDFIKFIFETHINLKWKGNYVFLFEKFVKSFNEEFIEKAFYLHREETWNGLLKGAMGSLIALMVGYNDMNFLRELFAAIFYCELKNGLETHSSLFTDVHDKNEFSKKSEEMKGDFKSEVDSHIDNIHDFFKEEVRNKQLIRAIKVHHEDFFGEGFPKKLKGNELSDLELIIIGMASIHFNDENIWEQTIAFFDKKPGGERISGMIIRLKEEFERKDEEYLEVAGL
ncbi:MAG: hypothetical protein GY909_05040 [Oligoflexia bacterium]|nr:hypothetical protein [Oligoflexia bacterium]